MHTSAWIECTQPAEHGSDSAGGAISLGSSFPIGQGGPGLTTSLIPLFQEVFYVLKQLVPKTNEI